MNFLRRTFICLLAIGLTGVQSDSILNSGECFQQIQMPKKIDGTSWFPENSKKQKN